MGRWASEHDTLQAFILLGQPWLGGFVGSLHNRMRDEHLKESLFDRLDHACTLIAAWSRATMKSTPTACWAGSHPTNTRSNGNNTTNNDQHLSKHLVRNTRPGHSTTSTTKTSSTRRNPLPNRPTFSYKSLWRLLIDRNMLKTQLQNLRAQSCKHCQARTRWERHHRCSS